MIPALGSSSDHVPEAERQAWGAAWFDQRVDSYKEHVAEVYRILFESYPMLVARQLVLAGEEDVEVIAYDDGIVAYHDGEAVACSMVVVRPDKTVSLVGEIVGLGKPMP